MRKSDDADVGFREDHEEVLADVGCNTLIQICMSLIKRAQTCSVKRIRGTLRLRFMDQDPF